MKPQIPALKKNNTFLESDTVYLRRREVKKGSKKILVEDSFEIVTLVKNQFSFIT